MERTTIERGHGVEVVRLEFASPTADGVPGETVTLRKADDLDRLDAAAAGPP